jgi:hypothetical protein
VCALENFQLFVFRELPGGTRLSYSTPMRALWRVNLMLVLNGSLLNREYTLINVLKALASIICMCNLHVTFLSKITLRTTYQYKYSYINTWYRALSVGDNKKNVQQKFR